MVVVCVQSGSLFSPTFLTLTHQTVFGLQRSRFWFDDQRLYRISSTIVTFHLRQPKISVRCKRALKALWPLVTSASVKMKARQDDWQVLGESLTSCGGRWRRLTAHLSVRSPCSGSLSRRLKSRGQELRPTETFFLLVSVSWPCTFYSVPNAHFIAASFALRRKKV